MNPSSLGSPTTEQVKRILAVTLVVPGSFSELARFTEVSGNAPESSSVITPDSISELTVELKQPLESFPQVEELLKPEFSPSAPLVSQHQSHLRPAVIMPFPIQDHLPSLVRPTSGGQLFHQRLAALKAGKIYTRLTADSFASTWLQTKAQPTHEEWQWLLALEAKAIASGQGDNRLNVLLGDSLSLWFPPEYLSRHELWLNQSVSGETSAHIKQRLSFLAATRPDRIYLLAGVNDLRRGWSDERILSNIHEIISQLRRNHPQAQIVLQSILPTRLPAIPNRRIVRLNEQIKAIAQSSECVYLDLYSVFLDHRGQLRRELTTDGIHLSRQGYEVWQESLTAIANPQHSPALISNQSFSNPPYTRQNPQL